jgi:ABC-type antimicrobial peptide transport system permease subunit
MQRNILAGSLALMVGLPLGWILTMIMTPLLWRLEPILNMELAGHSGPSDWVFYLGWGIVVPLLFLLFKGISAKRGSPHSQE